VLLVGGDRGRLDAQSLGDLGGVQADDQEAHDVGLPLGEVGGVLPHPLMIRLWKPEAFYFPGQLLITSGDGAGGARSVLQEREERFPLPGMDDEERLGHLLLGLKRGHHVGAPADQRYAFARITGRSPSHRDDGEGGEAAEASHQALTLSGIVVEESHGALHTLIG